MNQALKQLPSVDKLLQQPLMQDWVSRSGHANVVKVLREILAIQRAAIQAGRAGSIDTDHLLGLADTLLSEQENPSLKPVLNLTGTVLHTNLGRACLPANAIAAMEKAAAAVNIEFDLNSGKRGDRDDHVEALLCQLTGAEAATVVNNNAAAVLLVLNTLAKGKNVPVSRGELVEIGGSFRMPDIIESAGCRIREIGTTNRTHLKDYRQAIDGNTGVLLKVHTSNYRVEGFTKAVTEAELAAVANEFSLPLVSDLGSGSLIDMTKYNLPQEPQVSNMIAVGVDVVTFSGDKLLGGPQAGLIVGKKVFIEKIKANHLKRALRVDKVTMAALAEVLRLYTQPEKLAQQLPSLRWLSRSVDEIKSRAEDLVAAVQAALGPMAKVNSAEMVSQIGSGALPSETIASYGLAIEPVADVGLRDQLLQQLAQAFRKLPLPMVGRIHGGILYFDLRCLDDVEPVLAQLPALEISRS